MKHAWIALLVLVAGCAGGPSHIPGRGWVSVEICGATKTGVGPPSADEAALYNRKAPGETSPMDRVDYHDLDALVKLGDGPLDEHGPAAAPVRMTARPGAFDPPRVVMASGSRTRLTLVNPRSTELTLICVVGKNDGFEVRLGPGQSREVTLNKPGSYQVVCEEDEGLTGLIFVADSTFAAFARGNRVEFDNVPPGRYQVSVIPVRLPRPEAKGVDVTAESTAKVRIDVSVNQLSAPRK